MGPCAQLVKKNKVQEAEDEDQAVDMEERDPNEQPFNPNTDPILKQYEGWTMSPCKLIENFISFHFLTPFLLRRRQKPLQAHQSHRDRVSLRGVACGEVIGYSKHFEFTELHQDGP